MGICISGVTHRKFPFFFQWLAYLHQVWMVFARISNGLCFCHYVQFLSQDPCFVIVFYMIPWGSITENFVDKTPVAYGNSTIKLTLKWQCKIPLPAFWAFTKKGEAKKWQKECLSAYFSCKKRNPTAMWPQSASFGLFIYEVRLNSFRFI